jgi:hypothetical protein
MPEHMFRAIAGALSLALTIIVLQAFVPDVATALIEVILKVLYLASSALDNVPSAFPA